MTDLALRFAGGTQALIGGGFLIAALTQLGQADGRPDGDFGGWVQYGLGAVLAAGMVIVGLRIALGEEIRPWPGFALLVGSLGAGMIGLLLMGLAITD